MSQIPKTIHYCWFGGAPLPDLAQKCIASWRAFCPEYRIVRWDETTFDFEAFPYAKEALEAKKWAFVSDVARLYALHRCGGIYMDTDVEVLKPLDEILQYEAVSGFESDTEIPTGLMASKANHPFIGELLEEYRTAHFVQEDGSLDLTTNVTRITEACLAYGFVPNNTLQTVQGLTLLPKDFLCPKDYTTRKLEITDNTLVIHHFDGSWLSDEQKYVAEKARKLSELLGDKVSYKLAKALGVFKYRGSKGAFEFIKSKREI